MSVEDFLSRELNEVNFFQSSRNPESELFALTLEHAKSVAPAFRGTLITATCLNIIFVVSPYSREEVTDDGRVKSIMINVIKLPLCIGSNRLGHS